MRFADINLLMGESTFINTHTHLQTLMTLWHLSIRWESDMAKVTHAHPAFLIHNTSYGFNVILVSWWVTNVPSNTYLTALSVNCVFAILYCSFCTVQVEFRPECSLLAVCLKDTTQLHHFTCAIKPTYLCLSNICPALLNRPFTDCDFGLSLSIKCLLE